LSAAQTNKQYLTPKHNSRIQLSEIKLRQERKLSDLFLNYWKYFQAAFIMAIICDLFICTKCCFSFRLYKNGYKDIGRALKGLFSQ
jgi:hypothetical protein